MMEKVPGIALEAQSQPGRWYVGRAHQLPVFLEEYIDPEPDHMKTLPVELESARQTSK